ncbi:DUF4476 domain-containing protein [Flammeovirga sp. MY04]|uniref:DUF4476 domain-containing protein n=1 Tax=Flammeovirga sp. MY04 TaxID=1191459 RepID=UPI000A06300E|nr:DUF4476 domain-containing protein [Flammeovirga sp. MY04]ANQ50780.2 DUF4476 domain-containing protein [Flammeovirga sp. MY04]
MRSFKLLVFFLCMQLSYAQDDIECTHVSQADFEEALRSLTELTEDEFRHEIKLYTEKYCLDNEHIHMITKLFKADDERMEYLLFAFHYVEDWSQANTFDYHFEDELNKESFLNYVHSFHSEMADMHESVQMINSAPIDEDWERENLNEAAKVVYVKDYRGKIGANIPMATADYQILRTKLQKQGYDHEKIVLYKKMIQGKGLSVDQLNGILSLFSFENDKMKIFNSSLSSIYDLDNLVNTKQHFVNFFNKTEIDKVTNNKLNDYAVEVISKEMDVVYQQD